MFLSVWITMSKKRVNLKKLPKQNFNTDFLPLVSIYKYDIEGKNMTLTLNNIKIPNIDIATASTSEINKLKYSQLNNRIIFYANNGKNEVVEFSRHIKNLASHPENVKVMTVDGTEYYRFYDQNPFTKGQKTMKGIISVNDWKKLIASIQSSIQSINAQNNSNPHDTQKFDNSADHAHEHGSK